MIPGLYYIPNFITEDEENYLLKAIELNPWESDLKRRTQQYGVKYDYTIKGLNKTASVAEIPDWLSLLVSDRGFFPEGVDQAIINEYLPGQGIGKHKDASCFGDVIVSLSLLSLCSMILKSINNPEENDEWILHPRSLLVLSGPARHEYTHEIPARSSDMIEGEKVERQRRVSITFRTII